MMRDRINRVVRAFTLLEVLVAVGIIALLAVAIAAVFGAVGDTVTTGRRVSEMNAYAQRIEAIMREDFNRMTRDGFLVIRNEYANEGNNVELIDGDPDARRRRIDEIMFFMRGEFVTARRAISPDMIARSGQARLYYGHGQRMPVPEDLSGDPVQLARNDEYFRPGLATGTIDPDARLGIDPGPGIINPNEFASDWTLLRHVTLLKPPQEESQAMPSEFFGLEPQTNALDRNRMLDGPRQIALQPATRSIFRSLSLEGFATSDPLIRFFDRGDAAAWPTTASGLVDIASTDLSQIESIVTSTTIAPWQVRSQAQFDNTISNRQQTLIANEEPRVFPETVATRVQMQSWMLEAFPAPSTAVGNPQNMERIRYEPLPPLMFFPEEATAAPEGSERRLERAIRQADQAMLSAAGFVPRCTEFIVEWTYGWVDNSITDPSDPQYKQLQWFGLERNGENGERLAEPYRQRLPVEVPTGSNDFGPPLDLIARRNAAASTTAWNEVSYFGYFDPGPGPNMPTATAQLGTPGIGGNWDPMNNSAPWPWPKLIRITMSFADPNDATLETTYTAIFEVPRVGDL